MSIGEEIPQPAPEAASPEPAEEHEADVAQDAAGCVADEETRDPDTGLPAISTSDIAAAFHGIQWSRGQWVTALNKGKALSEWLEPALVERGKPGGGRRQSKWNPVKIS